MLVTLSPRATTLAIFFVQSTTFGGWFARVGDVQLKIGLSEDQLGLALTGAMFGALLTYPLGPPVVERFGTRAVALFSMPLTVVACALAPLAWDTLSLWLCIALTGIGHGLASMAANVEADRLEGVTGRRVMGMSYGVWSLSLVITTTIGAFAREIGVSPEVHLGVTVPIVLALILLVVGPMKEQPARPHVGPAKRTFAWPTKPIFGLLAFILGSVLLENGAMAWSVIYFRDMFDSPEWLESLSLPAFLLAVAVGRMFSDRWVDRYGPAKVASVLSVVAMVGLLPIAWAGSLPLAFIGFIVVGIGVSVAYPLSISGAARIGDRPASENVAAFSVLQRTLVLAAPAITGFVAAGWGIAGAFAAMLPFPLIAILCARYLEPKTVPVKSAEPA